MLSTIIYMYTYMNYTAYLHVVYLLIVMCGLYALPARVIKVKLFPSCVHTTGKLIYRLSIIYIHGSTG